MGKSITYSDAGVSIDAANAAVEKIKSLARTTFNARTLSEIGSFGGMFDGAFPGMSEPVLVASADGVGTKLKIAFMTGVHDTVGRDLVNHCTNDILVQGARPLFFLDYVATGVLAPDVIVSVVDGIARGCRENGCVLLGGESGHTLQRVVDYCEGWFPRGRAADKIIPGLEDLAQRAAKAGRDMKTISVSVFGAGIHPSLNSES